MFYQHNLSPIALSFGSYFSIHWYGLMYVFAFIFGLYLAKYFTKLPNAKFTEKNVDDILTYIILGVLLGGRLGYVIFYDIGYYIQNPLDIFKIWQGGMSFHGGFLGVLFAMLFWSKKNHKNFIELMDFIAPCVPIGLFFGRIGNFINGELWGNASLVPWAVIFPTGGNIPRHPSQLYEAGLEGLALFILLFYLAKKQAPKGVISAMFCIGYALARIFVEFYRVPDPQYGHFFGIITMGQILCLPMIAIGIILLFLAKKWNNTCN